MSNMKPMRFELWKCQKPISNTPFYNIYDIEQNLLLSLYAYSIKEIFEYEAELISITRFNISVYSNNNDIELIASANSIEELKGKVIEYLI